jgi:glutamate carboxypeptidase
LDVVNAARVRAEENAPVVVKAMLEAEVSAHVAKVALEAEVNVRVEANAPGAVNALADRVKAGVSEPDVAKPQVADNAKAGERRQLHQLYLPLRKTSSNGVMKPIVLLSLLLATVSLQAQSQALSVPEAAMITAVNASNAESLALLERIVNINSGTMNIPGVLRVRDVLVPRFEALGFKTRWNPMESAVNRAGDLLAEHPCPAGAGRCGKRLLLIAHMDTVFEPDSPFQKYTIVPGNSGNVVSGPGVNDTKGGLVVMLAALNAMKTAGVLDRTEITVVLSGDEERPGQPTSLSRRTLIEAGKRSDVALEFESTGRVDGRDTVRTARRSAVVWQLETTGVTGHSSQIFNDNFGYGAIYELIRILDAFREQLPEKGLTFNVGLMLGGTTLQVNDANIAGNASGKVNVIPPIARANGDLRTLSNEQTERVVAKMKAIVAAHLPKTGATLTIEETYPAMPESEGSRNLAGQLNAVNTDAKLPAMVLADAMAGGAGDIAFVAPFVPGLVGVGSAGTGAHSDSEIAYLDSIPTQAKRMAILMYRLSRQ